MNNLFIIFNAFFDKVFVNVFLYSYKTKFFLLFIVFVLINL